MLATLLVLATVSLAQAAPPAAPPPRPGAFGTSAVWPVTPEFLKSAHAACDNAKQPPSFEECFIDQMAKAGAPPDAVKFTRELYEANQQVGIMGRLHAFGDFAMTWVVYPLRANDNNGIMFVNTNPNFIDIDDLKRLDKAAMLKDPVFLEFKQTSPNLDVWPGDRSGASVYVEYARTYAADKPDDLRFLSSYPLIDGCHACARHGYANFWWDFDSKGNFLGTKFISVSRVPPPIKRARPRPPIGSVPAMPGVTTPPPAPPPQSGATAPEPATTAPQPH